MWLWGVLLIALAPGVPAQTPLPPAPADDLITLQLWSSNDRIIHGETPSEERLLREAQFVLSGLIFGWRFDYTPAWPERGVDRWFELEAIGGIEWGDPRLTVREARDDQGTLYAQLDFLPSPLDRERLRSWRSIVVERSGGAGTAALLDGYDGRSQAIREAIIQALRTWLRGRYPNRPRRVTGTVVLTDVPRVRTVAGEFEARVSIGFVVERVQDYVTF